MPIRTDRPFERYVLARELPRTGDSRKFELVLVYRVAGSERTAFIRWAWTYSGTQEAIDTAAGVEGYEARYKRQLAAFERHVINELKASGCCLYSVPGEELPEWGKL
jgi:hypothetical protein